MKNTTSTRYVEFNKFAWVKATIVFNQKKWWYWKKGRCHKNVSNVKWYQWQKKQVGRMIPYTWRTCEKWTSPWKETQEKLEREGTWNSVFTGAPVLPEFLLWKFLYWHFHRQNVSVLWLPLYCHPFEHLMELSLFADILENKLETLYEWFCRVNKTQA